MFQLIKKQATNMMYPIRNLIFLTISMHSLHFNSSTVQQFKPDCKKLLRSAASCDCSLCNVAKADFNVSRKLKKQTGRRIQVSPETTKQTIKVCTT